MQEMLGFHSHLMKCRFNAKKESIKLSFFILRVQLAIMNTYKHRTALEASIRLETVGLPSQSAYGDRSLSDLTLPTLYIKRGAPARAPLFYFFFVTLLPKRPNGFLTPLINPVDLPFLSSSRRLIPPGIGPKMFFTLVEMPSA